MVSTYSPDLRLELMATGDQSGTWGTTTNTNLGTLLEQAICGVLSVAEGDATLTLTALNGASDQSRNAVVILTGAVTAQRNVVVPTSAKLYLMVNSTTGGFSVNVTTVAGTGTLIPPGQSRWVYCDGTNVNAGLTGYRTESFTTTATAAATTTLTSTSFSIQEFTGTTTQTVLLPVTSTLFLGKTYTIINDSTGAVTVQSSGANNLVTLAAGTWATVECALTSGTTAASWLSQYLGAVIVSGKKLTVSNSLTLAGTDGTTITFPSTSATVARTDAANTFTGVQTVGNGGSVLLNSDNNADGDQISVVTTTKTAALYALSVTRSASLVASITLAGVANFATLSEAGQRVYSPNNPQSAQPIPTTSVFAVGTLALGQNESGSTVASLSTIAGTNLDAAGSPAVSSWNAGGGATQTGTWKNLSGSSIVAGGWGYWVRTA